MRITLGPMATTTVRLDAEDEAILDQLADVYGGRSAAIRHALRALANRTTKQQLLDEFLADWQAEAGPVDEAAVAEMIRRYNL